MELREQLPCQPGSGGIETIVKLYSCKFIQLHWAYNYYIE